MIPLLCFSVNVIGIWLELKVQVKIPLYVALDKSVC